MGDSQPTPPSPGAGIGTGQQVSNIQQGYNTAAQQASNYNQANPYGNISYSQYGTGPGGVPLYQANVNLSPVQQALFNLQQGTKGAAGAGAYNLLTGADYGVTDPFSAISNMAGGMTSGMLGQEVSYLNPFFNLQSQQEQAQLANQGFTPGSTAYNNAMMPLWTGQNLDVSNFLAQAYPQAYGLSAQTYGIPAALGQQLGAFGGPISPTSQAVQGAGLTPPNMNQAYQTAQQAAWNQYQAEQAQYNAQQQGLGDIIGAGASIALAPFTGGASLMMLPGMMGGALGGGGGGGGSGGMNNMMMGYALGGGMNPSTGGAFGPGGMFNLSSSQPNFLGGGNWLGVGG